MTLLREVRLDGFQLCCQNPASELLRILGLSGEWFWNYSVLIMAYQLIGNFIVVFPCSL